MIAALVTLGVVLVTVWVVVRAARAIRDLVGELVGR